MYKVSDIIAILENKFPKKYSEEWDNVGLIIGEKNKCVKKIQISLDITAKVIEKAIKTNVDLIITHHPFIFKSIKQINNNTKTGDNIIKLIKNDIAVYTLHTNLDAAQYGLNELIVKKLGIDEFKILDVFKKSLYKFNFFVPENELENVRDEIVEENNALSEKYSKISYKFYGEETFFPSEKAQPFVGDKKKLNTVKIYKVEVLTTKDKINSLLQVLRRRHPYEEPAYEIIESNEKIDTENGIGRIYELEKPMLITEYAKFVKEKLHLETIKAIYYKDKLITKIGVINGSGFSYADKIRRAGVDLFISADLKYHEALDISELGLCIFDIGHYESEVFFSDIIVKLLPADISVSVFNNGPIFRYI